MMVMIIKVIVPALYQARGDPAEKTGFWIESGMTVSVRQFVNYYGFKSLTGKCSIPLWQNSRATPLLVPFFKNEFV